MRTVEAERITNETEIRLKLSVDGQGAYSVDTGCGFLNHMLELFARHGGFNLELSCRGDVEVDDHHTVEDVGIALGQAFAKALGDKRGITRYGNMLLPMDEALAEATVDLSGRPWLEWRGGELLPPVLAGEEKDLWREFYKAFASSARCNLHVDMRYGKNGHHLLESAAKGLGLALAQAVRRHGTTIRSTKGSLD